MSKFEFVNEATIAICLIVAIIGLSTVTIISGADSIAATGLRDLAILLGGALAGTKVPKP